MVLCLCDTVQHILGDTEVNKEFLEFNGMGGIPEYKTFLFYLQGDSEDEEISSDDSEYHRKSNEDSQRGVHERSWTTSWCVPIWIMT